jgi:hypothetical protein
MKSQSFALRQLAGLSYTFPVMQDLSSISPTLAALIAAGGTALGATLSGLVTTYLNNRRDQGRFVEVDSPRKEAVVSGAWEGLGQNISIEGGAPDADAFSMTVAFRRTKGNKLTADLTLFAPPPDFPGTSRDTVDEIVMTGGFFDDWYLEFSYRNKELRRKQMGVIVVRLSGNCDRTFGHYAGFSPYREKFVVGEVELYRPGQHPERIASRNRMGAPKDG